MSEVREERRCSGVIGRDTVDMEIRALQRPRALVFGEPVRLRSVDVDSGATVTIAPARPANQSASAVLEVEWLGADRHQSPPDAVRVVESSDLVTDRDPALREHVAGDPIVGRQERAGERRQAAGSTSDHRSRRRS